VVHATEIRIEGGRVRFVLHPAAGPLSCEAPLSDIRRVTSSNGSAALRPFIRTSLSLGGLEAQEVEVSLSARPAMRFAVLVGRAALAGWSVLVDPTEDA
jgi:hypothetical protein